MRFSPGMTAVPFLFRRWPRAPGRTGLDNRRCHRGRALVHDISRWAGVICYNTAMYDDPSTPADETELRRELADLRARHRELDSQIQQHEAAGEGVDRLAVQRLKRTKLALADRIAWLEDKLTPDIIA